MIWIVDWKFPLYSKWVWPGNTTMTLQTDARHREEEPQNTNSHNLKGNRKIIKSKATSFLFPIKPIAKLGGHKVKQASNTEPHKQWGNNKQSINNNRTTSLERTAAKAIRGGGGAGGKYSLMVKPYSCLNKCWCMQTLGLKNWMLTSSAGYRPTSLGKLWGYLFGYGENNYFLF